MSGKFANTARIASRAAVGILLIGFLLAPAPVIGQRSPVKPGFNIYSPQQDIEVGKQFSQEAEHQLQMLNDPKVDNYLNTLGRKLAAKAPGEKYPYQYKCVNDRVINAFALPGGFVYINRGVIEAADNEAQLAAVMAHETSHVALRHGTNQASKASFAQGSLAILGGLLGNNAVGGLLEQLGGFGLNSILLKNSRDAEKQADVLGTQILYDSGYDPRAMAQFMEKLEAQEKKGGAPMEFFSNHPSPEHRVERAMTEVEKLGGPPANYKKDSSEFEDIKRHVLALPPPPKVAPGASGPAGASGGKRPVAPSNALQTFENDVMSLRYPDNWKSNGQGSAASLVPDGGVVDDGTGKGALAWGVIVSVYEPNTDSAGNVTLEDANNQLIEDLRHNNASMKILRKAERMKMGGGQALSTYLTDDSPVGGKETVWLVSAIRPSGLVHLICVAPQNDFDAYTRAFESIVSSVNFRGN